MDVRYAQSVGGDAACEQLPSGIKNSVYLTTRLRKVRLRFGDDSIETRCHRDQDRSIGCRGTVGWIALRYSVGSSEIQCRRVL